jgi:hypothetical protein
MDTSDAFVSPRACLAVACSFVCACGAICACGWGEQTVLAKRTISMSSTYVIVFVIL